MSWDTTVKESPCPCGKGTIVKTSRQGDWNGQYEYHEGMNCDDCKGRYAYHPIRVGPSEMQDWIPIEHKAKLDAEDREFRERLKAETEAAREKYSAQLIAACARIKARKKVWDLLDGTGGIGQPVCSSFGEFNRRVRVYGRDAAIRSLIDRTNVEAVEWFLQRIAPKLIG